MTDSPTRRKEETRSELDLQREDLRNQLSGQRRNIAQRIEPENRDFPRSMMMRLLMRRPSIAMQILISLVAGVRALMLARRQKALTHLPAE